MVTAISLDTVTLHYDRNTRRRSIREMIVGKDRTGIDAFTALDGVTVQIKPGERVGIIGDNGSGKSTLLKIMAGIIEPDRGTAVTRGRVGALLELGAGFHPDLTGTENVHLNAALLGVDRATVRERFADIVDFADVAEFMDQPVRTWSSGMYVRLGFAVAAQLEPDVLLIDEVLAVGDQDFQARCAARMSQVAASGTTVVLVSHDLDAVSRLCDRVVLMDHGRVVADGPSDVIVAQYRALAAGRDQPESPTLQPANDQIEIESVDVRDHAGVRLQSIAPGTYVHVATTIRCTTSVDFANLGLRITAPDGTLVHEVHTVWQGLAIGPLEPGTRATVDVRFTAHLLGGRYGLEIFLTDIARKHPLSETFTGHLEISPKPGGIGLVALEASTKVANGPGVRIDTEIDLRPEPATKHS